MSSRLVKKQLNSLISESEPAEAKASSTRGLKKREARQKRIRQRLAKKEQDAITKVKDAKSRNTKYFAETARANEGTVSLMHDLLGIKQPQTQEEDISDFLDDFM